MNKRNAAAAIIGIAVSVSSFTIGCGSSVTREQRDRPTSPAMQIDPFEFGDEFTIEPGRPSAGETPVDSGDSASGTESMPLSGEAIPTPGNSSLLAPGERTIYRIQLSGAFDNRAEADQYAERARRRLDVTITVEYRAPFYRVFAGSFATQGDAETYVRFLRQEGFDESRWVPVTGTAP